MANADTALMEVLTTGAIFDIARMLKTGSDCELFPDERLLLSFEWCDLNQYRETVRYLKMFQNELNHELAQGAGLDVLQYGKYSRAVYRNGCMVVS